MISNKIAVLFILVISAVRTSILRLVRRTCTEDVMSSYSAYEISQRKFLLFQVNQEV